MLLRGRVDRVRTKDLIDMSVDQRSLKEEVFGPSPGKPTRRDTQGVDAPNVVDRSQDSQLAPEEAFEALADQARLAVLHELQRGTRCVCELAPKLGMAPNLVSYHLRVLREAGIVEGSRRGRRVEYRVRPETLQELAVGLVRLAVGAREGRESTC